MAFFKFHLDLHYVNVKLMAAYGYCTFNNSFYTPPTWSNDRKHLLFVLSVCLSLNFNLICDFWPTQGQVFMAVMQFGLSFSGDINFDHFVTFTLYPRIAPAGTWYLTNIFFSYKQNTGLFFYFYRLYYFYWLIYLVQQTDLLRNTLTWSCSEILTAMR